MKLLAFRKEYEGVCVLDFPGAELSPGTVYAVIGANGSGKSTFAKILAGTLNPDGGSFSLKPHTVGYMPQKSYGYRMSVWANIRLGGTNDVRANSLIEALQLGHLAKKRADKLSGGETARVALARVLMRPCDLLILDEPTSAMDMETTILAEAQIRRYVEETGAAVILVTHSLQQAKRLADEVMFFRKGQLIESGPAGKMLTAPRRPETSAFLDFYGR